MRSERRQKKIKYWNLHAVVMSNCSLIAIRNSHAKHNQSVVRIPEHRQGRVAYQRHEMGSERRQKNCKNWNLHPVVMSDYSLKATRNSHAKQKKSVDRIPEHRQAKDFTQRITNDHVLAEKLRVETR